MASNQSRQVSQHIDTTPTIVSPGILADEDSWTELVAAVHEQEAKNRERCRVEAVQYRKKQRDRTVHLEKDIEDLQLEIRRLDRKKQRIAANTFRSRSPWCVVGEYFRVFRFGYKARGFGTMAQQQRQLAFLRAVMAPDVIDGPRCGVEAMVNCWELHMLCCPEFEWHLRRMESGGDGVVTAVSTIAFTVSNRSLRYVLGWHSGDDDEAELATKLLGQRLRIQSQIDFHWDDETGRVQMLVSKLDVETALLELLGNLVDVSRVWKKTFLLL